VKKLNNRINLICAVLLAAVCMLQNSYVVAAATLIMDNGDPGTSSNGTWKVSDGDDPYGDHSLYTREAGASYTYDFNLATPGEYQLYAWWSENRNSSSNVPIDIGHQAGTSTVTVNQRKNEGEWRRLGSTWTFGDRATVTIRSLGNGTTCADALKLVYVDSGNGSETALSSFPIELRGATPEETVVTLNVSKPVNVVDATITLNVFDADFPNEGELIINSNAPVVLFGNAGNSGNDNNSTSVSLSTPASYWRDGDNTLLFRHTRTQGYIIDAATVTFELSQAVLNTAPILANIGDRSVTAGTILEFIISATDNDGTVPILEASGLPAYALFHDFYDGTGRVTLSPDAATPQGMENITLTARDARDPALTDSETITITIGAASNGGTAGSVSLSWIPPSEREDGTALLPGEISGYTVYYGAASASYSNSLYIDNGLATSASIVDLAPGTYYMAVTTRDSDGRESAFSSEIVNVVN
jgi:hypothetical protein